MARVAALIPDLLFGSKVQGALQAAGHEVFLLGEVPRGDPLADVLVVDLTADAVVSTAVLEELVGLGVPTLGFFAHVEPEVRERALQAGFTQAVPRSRMHREAVGLVEALVAEP